MKTQERLEILVEIPGTSLGFSHAAFSTPVIHATTAFAIAEFASKDVQLFQVDIKSQPKQYVILNATRTIRCIDDTRCEEVARWTEEDGLPWKVGQYEHVYGMRIDPTKVGEAKVFRPWGWKVLVVAEEIKEAMERLGTTGTKFKEV